MTILSPLSGTQKVHWQQDISNYHHLQHGYALAIHFGNILLELNMFYPKVVFKPGVRLVS